MCSNHTHKDKLTHKCNESEMETLTKNVYQQHQFAFFA